MKYISGLLLILIYSNLFGQFEGDKWVVGYFSLGSPEYSIMNFDFRGDHMKIEYHFDQMMEMHETGSNVCNESGVVILWTNGMQIFGKNGIYVCDTIAYSSGPLGYWEYGSMLRRLFSY